jgi:hypothetical protein
MNYFVIEYRNTVHLALCPTELLLSVLMTIVLFLSVLNQSSELVENTFHTGWLDLRIARKVLTGGPPWHLAVIAGAVVKAHEHISSLSAEYLAFLSKGQLPPAGIRSALPGEWVISVLGDRALWKALFPHDTCNRIRAFSMQPVISCISAGCTSKLNPFPSIPTQPDKLQRLPGHRPDQVQRHGVSQRTDGLHGQAERLQRRRPHSQDGGWRLPDAGGVDS